ncbi:unnamed protein product, partial [Toxocara canis]|uniref:CNNM transmembrane domain-containing protein n=1 Tax=Toxocara canis TaxID=6265 RepID=A0A183VH11_TOXCA
MSEVPSENAKKIAKLSLRIRSFDIERGGDSEGDTSERSAIMELLRKMQVLLTVRMFTAVLLCMCFIALSSTTSNLAGTMVCMFAPKPEMLGRIKRFMNESEEKRDFVEELIWKIGNESAESKNASSLTACEWSMITRAIEHFPATKR